MHGAHPIAHHVIKLPTQSEVIDVRTAATDHQGGISSHRVKLPSCSKAHYIVKLPSSNAAQGHITAAIQLRISSLQHWAIEC
jgi:hypothetical protein